MKKAIYYLVFLFTGIMFICSCEKLETDVSDSEQTTLKSFHKGAAIIVFPAGDEYDTENLLNAFAAAEEKGPGSVILLTAGEFYLDKLDIYNFCGILKGAGKGRTIIHTIPGGIHLPVSEPYIETFPYLIDFHGGNFVVSDMSFDISDENPVEPYEWWSEEYVTLIGGVIRVSGLSPDDYTSNATLKNLGFKGKYVELTDATPYNIDNCILLGGSYESYAMKGNYVVQNCEFEGAETGINSIGLSHSRFIVGGDRRHGNKMNNVNAGVLFLYGDQTDVNITGNIITNIQYYSGIQIAQNYYNYEFNKNIVPSACRFIIQDNIIKLAGVDGSYWPDAIFIYDLVGRDDASKQSKAFIQRNIINLTGGYQTAVNGYCTYNTDVFKNVISGYSSFAIIAYGNSSGWKLVFNDFTNYEGEMADILLYDETSDNTVICDTSKTTVYDASGLNIIKGPCEFRKPPVHNKSSFPGKKFHGM